MVGSHANGETVTEQECANRCGEAIRRVTPEDGLDARDFSWVHVSGNPYCDLVPVATPLAEDPDGEHRVPPSAEPVPADVGPRMLGTV